MDIQPEPGVPANPPAPDDAENEAARIQRNAILLLEFFQADPSNRAYIDRTIRQHIQNGVKLESWGRILSGLTVYAGEDLATFVLTVLLRSEDTEFLALIEAYAPPEVWSYLRGLMALYSDELREVYAIFGENPQGWRTINRRVYFDHLTDTWRANFELIKFNGDRFHLDETPTSAIVLCQAILDALNSVPVEAAPQIADRDAVENLIGLLYAFVEHFAPDYLEAEGG